VQVLERMLRRYAILHRRHYRAAEHKWVESRKAFLRSKAKKIRAEKDYKRQEMYRIHHKQHELNRLKRQYRDIMHKVTLYKAKRHVLRKTAHLRWVKFEKVFAQLKAKAKRLHDIRLLEGRRNHAMELEIKTWEHKKWMLEKARKHWRNKFEELQKRERNKVNKRAREALERVQKYKIRVREIIRDVHERNLIGKRRISRMRDHLRKQKWLIAHLRAILAKEVRKVVMITRRQEKVAKQTRRWKAKGLHELAVHKRLEKRENADVRSKRRKIHRLFLRLSRLHHVYNWARNEQKKVKSQEERRYREFVRKTTFTRRLAIAHERAMEKKFYREAMRKSFLRLRKLQKVRAGYLKMLRRLQRKMSWQQRREEHQKRVAQLVKREWRSLELQKAKYQHEKVRYLRVLARGRHLREQEQAVRLKLAIILRRERNWDKTYQNRRKTLIQRWKHRVERSNLKRKTVRKELVILRRKYTHQRWTHRMDVLALKKLKLHLMKVVHENHLIELRLRQLERTIHKGRSILKRRGAYLDAKWREQQKAFAKIANQKKLFERKLLLLKKKLVLGRKYERRMKAQYTEWIIKEREGNQRLVHHNHLMWEKLEKREARVRRDIDSETKRQRRNAWRLEHEGTRLAKELSYQQRSKKILRKRLNAKLKQLFDVRKEIQAERIKGRKLAQKYGREIKTYIREWQSKHKVLEEKIRHVIRVERELRKQARVVRFKKENALRRKRKEWLLEKHLLRRMRHFRRARNVIEHKVRLQNIGLRRLRSEVTRELDRQAVLRRKVRIIDRNGKIELMKERARFERVREQEAAKQRRFRAVLRRIRRDLIKERVEGRNRLMEERSRQKRRARMWAAKRALKVHKMVVREGRLIARLKVRVLVERRRLLQEKTHWAKELAKLKAKQMRDVHIRKVRIHALELNIIRERHAAELNMKNTKAKWNHNLEVWKRRTKAKLEKLNNIRARDSWRLKRKRMEVARERREYRAVKKEVFRERYLLKRELQKQGVLKGKRAWWFGRLKHVKQSVRKYSHILVVQERALQKAHRQEEKLARAVKALKKRKERWELLERRRALREKQLRHWKVKVMLIKKKIVAQKRREREVQREAKVKLEVYRSKLVHVTSFNHFFRNKFTKGVKKLRWLRARLAKLKRAQAREETRVRHEVAKVRHLTMRVHHLHIVIVDLKKEVRREIFSLEKYKHLVESAEGGVMLLKQKLRRGRRKFHAESRKEKHVLLRIQEERHLNELNNLKLRKIRLRLRAMMGAKTWSHDHERKIDNELKLNEIRMRHLQAEFVLENRRFMLRLREKRKREAVQRRHILRKIGRLLHQLNVERGGLRKLAKQKRAALRERASLLATLNAARRVKARQLILFEKEHEALIMLEIKVKQQYRLIKHLRFLYSCGKFESLARKGRKYSHLLRGQGLRLEQLVHELYAVEKKVGRLGKTLKEHASRREKGVLQRRKELKMAERYVKWAHHMMRYHK